MIDVIWDMETGDPDDFLTLILLLGHPGVNLKAVCVTPGSPEQVGLIRHALSWFDKEIPVGSYRYNEEWDTKAFQKIPKSLRKNHVSSWHYKTFGDIPPSYDAEPGWQVYHRLCNEDTTLITGAPLTNLGRAIQMSPEHKPDFTIGRWFAQGGFAGEGVIPEEKQLSKFKGKVTCPTWNLGGAPKAALAALRYEGIGLKHFVSKNVCHGVYYNKELHQKLAEYRNKRRSLRKIWDAMVHYLKKRSQGKKFHDPLAACCAIQPDIAQWAEVELYLQKGEWGSRLSPGSQTWIITDVDMDAFFEVLVM
mgnify:CR=1 FL=1